MISFFKDHAFELIALLSPIGIVLLTLKVRLSSRSSSGIMNKLWAVFYGEKDYYDPEINEYAKESHDLDKFNATNGFLFDDREQVKQFLTWVKDNNYRVYWFSGLGMQFNSKTFTVTKPTTMNIVNNIILSLVFLALLIPMLIFGKFKDLSGDLYMIDYFNIYTLTFSLIFGIYISITNLISYSKAKKTIRKMECNIQ